MENLKEVYQSLISLNMQTIIKTTIDHYKKNITEHNFTFNYCLMNN